MLKKGFLRKASIILISLLLTATSTSSAFSSSSTSYLELRSAEVVRQSSWFTCGPAALSSLLTYFFEDPLSETDALTQSLEAMQKTSKDIEKVGVTALALKTVLERKGYETEGYSLSLEQLGAYFLEGGLPVILHVTRPEQHYVVAVGVVGGSVVLADPSWGRKIIPLEALISEKGFDGVTLVALPPDDAQGFKAQAAQKAWLDWATARSKRLNG